MIPVRLFSYPVGKFHWWFCRARLGKHIPLPFEAIPFVPLDLPACFYHDVSGQAILGYRENTASRLLYGSLNISFN